MGIWIEATKEDLRSRSKYTGGRITIHRADQGGLKAETEKAGIGDGIYIELRNDETGGGGAAYQVFERPAALEILYKLAAELGVQVGQVDELDALVMDL